MRPQLGDAMLEAHGGDPRVIHTRTGDRSGSDRPDAIPDPALVTSRVVFELHAEASSLLACRTRELKATLGRDPTHDELVIALCTASTGDRSARSNDRPSSTGDRSEPSDSTGDRSLRAINDEPGSEEAGAKSKRRPERVGIPPPRAQQLFTTCKHCARSELLVDGQALAIDRATAERLACDVVLVGDADSDDNTRVRSAIPAGIRRKVFMRDAFQCVVPGCTARKHLDIHHLRHREHGGMHTMSTCAVLCSFHHKSHHDGLLEITGVGVAPHRLEFSWRGDAGPTWDEPAN